MNTTIDTSKKYIGTCQCCFNEQVTKTQGKGTDVTMVLHGYERPGVGWIQGQCRGVRRLPYELSCEMTKTWLVTVSEHLAQMQERLGQMKSDKIESYSKTVTDYSKPYSYRGRPTMMLTVKRGETVKVSGYGPISFESVRQDSIRELSSSITATDSLRAFLAGKVQAWKYAPEALLTHETKKAEKVAASAAIRAEKKAARDAKDLAKYNRPVSKAKFAFLKRLVEAGGYLFFD